VHFVFLCIFSFTLQLSSIDSELFVENHDFCLTHLHSIPPLRGSHRHIAIRFGVQKLEWFGYPTVNKSEDMITRFDRITSVTDG